MRDLIVEKASPISFLVIVAWYLDAPRRFLQGLLYELCLNMCDAIDAFVCFIF